MKHFSLRIVPCGRRCRTGNDRDEDWVAVWAREFTVDKKGEKDTADIHEIWLLRDGKARSMSQYRSHRKP